RKIAEMAGVSRSAVDKVIHDRPGVRPEVRELVWQIIEETGYVPIHKKVQPVHMDVKKKVAIIMPKLNNPYFLTLKQGIDSRAILMPDLELAYYFCDISDVSGMIQILESLEYDAIDLYIIRGVRSKRLRDKLNSMAKPIIFMDSVVPGADMLCFVGEDGYQSGRIAASLLAKTISKQGEIVVIGGSPAVSGHKLRLEGFMDAVRTRWPDIHITEQIYSQDEGILAYEYACKVLNQNPNLRGICNLAGFSGEIGQAIMDCHRQDSVKMVCYNILGDVDALIQKGIVDFSIHVAPFHQGQILLETAFQFLVYNKIPSQKYLYIPVSIALDENIDALLAADREG
ncbi:MAG: LacI family DNA-binding transcriptional regulator, partial [Eubacteriales bacterium]|nr:LacI family DNA-binding transcriptional regulator [Eubacteriales bacterium]